MSADNAPNDIFTAVTNTVRDLFADMMKASGRPSVVQSESGVSSVTLKQLASGATQAEVKVYHVDPYEAARLARAIYEAEINYWAGHAPVK